LERHGFNQAAVAKLLVGKRPDGLLHESELILRARNTGKLQVTQDPVFSTEGNPWLQKSASQAALNSFARQTTAIVGSVRQWLEEEIPALKELSSAAIPF
jgi:hypothetical protein